MSTTVVQYVRVKQRHPTRAFHEVVAKDNKLARKCRQSKWVSWSLGNVVILYVQYVDGII